MELIHTNAIYNIYKRKLPITMGVNIEIPKAKNNTISNGSKSKAIIFKTIRDGGLTNLSDFQRTWKVQ